MLLIVTYALSALHVGFSLALLYEVPEFRTLLTNQKRLNPLRPTILTIVFGLFIVALVYSANHKYAAPIGSPPWINLMNSGLLVFILNLIPTNHNLSQILGLSLLYNENLKSKLGLEASETTAFERNRRQRTLCLSCPLCGHLCAINGGQSRATRRLCLKLCRLCFFGCEFHQTPALGKDLQNLVSHPCVSDST